MKLIISAKKVHPGTKTSTVVEPPPGSLNQSQGQAYIPPQRARTVAKYKRRTPAKRIVNRIPESNHSLLDDFQASFNEDYDDDDGFTTIKDLAERGVTKMEPLDYNAFTRGYYGGGGGGTTSKVKEEESFDLNKVKDEPDVFDPDYVVNTPDPGPSTTVQKDTTPSERKQHPVEFKREPGFEDDDFDNVDEPAPGGPMPRKYQSGYKPAPDRRIYGCLYCPYNGRKLEWLDHLRNQHPDKTLVRMFLRCDFVCHILILHSSIAVLLPREKMSNAI